jgi:hypothetical protein
MQTKSNQHEWPQRETTSLIATNGVTKTQAFFDLEANWLFREQPSQDYGIDAHVEVVEGKNVKGRLLALQIKSGDTALHPRASGGWDFYPKLQHVNYWQNHSLPVVVVVWEKSSGKLLFREASRSTLERTRGSGYKLHFTEQNFLDKSALPELVRLSSGTSYDLRLRELGLLLPWMTRLADGQRLILNAEEWVNKTSGRGALTVTALNGADQEEVIGSWGIAPGSTPYHKVLPALFQWADLEMDPSVGGSCLSESETEADQAIFPYKNAIDEVHFWSLELHLNDVGRAFMILDEYARAGRITQLAP